MFDAEQMLKVYLDTLGMNDKWDIICHNLHFLYPRNYFPATIHRECKEIHQEWMIDIFNKKYPHIMYQEAQT